MSRPSKKTVKERKPYAWMLLLQSRHARPPEKVPVGTGERGRPRLNVATTQTSITLSKGDREALNFWQEHLFTLLNRKVSMGETAGFLARVCQERLNALGEAAQPPDSLEELVLVLVSGLAEDAGA